MARIPSVFVFALTLLFGCAEKSDHPAWPPPVSIPKENPMSEAKIALGRKLFFEKALSRDSTVSCGSCHLPNFAFADTVAFSRGVGDRRATRNTPSLVNIAYAPRLMAEGGVNNLELQVLSPLENPLEMDMTVGEVCRKLNCDAAYRQAFLAVWGDTATPFTLTRTLAAYERTLVGGCAPYDNFTQGDSTALTANQRAGLVLFMQSGCANCHAQPLFTNHTPENNGLDSVPTDYGLFRLTLRTEDIGKFKTPTLRNVALTAPYMHDGRFITLEEVVEHYNAGGMHHANKSPHIKPLGLSETEKAQLVEFLRALTQTSPAK